MFYQKFKRLNILIYLLIKIVILNSCNLNNSNNILKTYFGSLPNGNEVYKYKLTNDYMSVDIINYGGIITNINLPDSKGKNTDVVLGFKTLDQYIEEHQYPEYSLAKNSATHYHLSFFQFCKKELLNMLFCHP